MKISWGMAERLTVAVMPTAIILAWPLLCGGLPTAAPVTHCNEYRTSVLNLEERDGLGEPLEPAMMLPRVRRSLSLPADWNPYRMERMNGATG